MLPEGRVEKLLRAATLAVGLEAPLSKVVTLPLLDARRILRRFPGVGEPGADRLLLFSRARPLLGLESNGLRVLVRLGFGQDHRQYTRTWREVTARVSPEAGDSVPFAVRAHLVLRQHGQRLCTL